MFYVTVQASEAKQLKLSGSGRDEKIAALKSSGWSVVADRDAIYKELVFKNFNEVIYCENYNLACLWQ